MYIDDVYLNIGRRMMSLQIANPAVVAKVERLARETGMTKTALVERAVDLMASEMQLESAGDRMAALLAQLDRIPDRGDAFDPLPCDSQGLPK